MPVKTGTADILIRSAAPDDVLRPDRSHDAGLRGAPRRFNPTMPQPRCVPRATWRLRFLEFPPTLLGYGKSSASAKARPHRRRSRKCHDIEIDRVYLHGDPLYGQKRGIA
jgi:hypothetical protein